MIILVFQENCFMASKVARSINFPNLSYRLKILLNMIFFYLWSVLTCNTAYVR